MKRIILTLVVAAALVYLGRSHHWGSRDVPDVITNPVYAEVRFRTEFQDRSISAVAYAKAADDADCHRMSESLVKDVLDPEHAEGGPVWRHLSTTCKRTIDARVERLFANKSTFVNYISAARGDRNERESRLIFWGVTAEEGDRLCGEIPRIQTRWKGAVTCVHAVSSQ